MGAAIPHAMTLALAIQDNLPCEKEATDLRIYTGSEECIDEVIPTESHRDLQYQVRVKSSVRIRLSIKTKEKVVAPLSNEQNNAASTSTSGPPVDASTIPMAPEDWKASSVSIVTRCNLLLIFQRPPF
jgi:hypothetical protein